MKGECLWGVKENTMRNINKGNFNFLLKDVRSTDKGC